jgi:hypothetical protein
VSDAYGQFLASKRRVAQSIGPKITAGDVHPLLHDWQREVVVWSVAQGRAALFEDCGLGKTFQQLEWARLSADTSLILAPLTVARQTVREAHKIDMDVRYVRHGSEVTGPGVWITNYEMAEHFDPSMFGALVADESSLLKNVDGKTRQMLTKRFASVPYRLACTATPAPNDVAELTTHAEFLGLMSRAEMLAAYFVHDEDGWRLKGHGAEPMYQWMATWAVALRRPSDMGYSDDGYVLPPLRIVPEVVHAEVDAGAQLFATDLGGVGGRAAVRRSTLAARVDRAVELVTSNHEQWIVWCGLNSEADAVTARVADAINVEGSQAPDVKAKALEAFQDGEVRVLVSKPSVCGHGMNFQQCSRMVFVGLSDSWESYYQAIRRCFRFGQTRPVNAHIVVSALEQQIVDNVRRKEEEAARMTEALVRHVSVGRGVAA